MESCEDCIHCGVIIDPGYDLYGDELPLKKYCPEDYLFDHPNAKECKNFRQKGKPEIPWRSPRGHY